MRLLVSSVCLTMALTITTPLFAGGVVEVGIKDFLFLPQEITIKPGDSVRWVNQEKRQFHSVWFEQLGEPEPDYLFPDDVYERKFEQSGDFPYRCGPHPEMTGVVHVRP